MRCPLTFIITSLAIFSCPASYAQTKVFVEYAGIFDQQCAPVFKMEIKQDQIHEAYERIPEFQKAWDKDGPAFIEKAKDLLQRPYPRKELTLSTTLCGFVPMASPYMVNIRPYLKSTSGQLPMASFTQLGFHEWIHLYLETFFDFNSPILEKYKDETFNVKAHLHLMALEKAVYATLKREDFLNSANNVYGNVIKGDYARSWEIVEKEGFQKFLKELKSAKPATQ
jgi:hypothetical protein